MNLEYLASPASEQVLNLLSKASYEIWRIFSIVTGDPTSGNSGVRFLLTICFTLFLLVILQLRMKILFDRVHLVALVGGLFLLVRAILLLCFEWGWQVGLYTDRLLYLLSPPLEHFFNMMFFGCMAYYSLNVYQYYPGLLKKIIWIIPISIFSFFVYTTITWKAYFLKAMPGLSTFTDCPAYWQTYAIIALASLYIFMVAIYKYKKHNCFLSAFWTMIFFSYSARALSLFSGSDPAVLVTIFQGTELVSILVLSLHFVNYYAQRKTCGLDRNPCLCQRSAAE